MPRLSQPETMMMEALHDLERDWEIARTNWLDSARQNFEKDFLGGVWKSLVFGGLVSLVAVWYGFSARPTGASRYSSPRAIASAKASDGLLIPSQMIQATSAEKAASSTPASLRVNTPSQA